MQYTVYHIQCVYEYLVLLFWCSTEMKNSAMPAEPKQQGTLMEYDNYNYANLKMFSTSI